MATKRSSAPPKKSAQTAATAPAADLRLCIDRVVPEPYHPARSAAERAVMESVRSFESSRGTIDASGPLPLARIALVKLKMWEKGRKLNCRFLDGDATQKRKVEEKAHLWEQYANIKFQFVTSGDAEIRISFTADPGSWSAVGTDALVESYFPKFQPTMNFGWLRDGTADQEYERVVVHEFGHALGCIHEHQNPKAKLQWNKAEVYRVFSGPPNYWSKDDIDFNILKRYSKTQINGTAFDPDSIMLYQFPASLFLDHHGTKLNTTLSNEDKEFIAKMYPK
jgi:serralysin